MEASASSPSCRRQVRTRSGPSTLGANRESANAHRSRAKYSTTAARVPKCSSTSKASSGVGMPRTFGTIDRCADDEIGRNSVSPWTIPSTSARSTSHLEAGAGKGVRADAGTLARHRGDQCEQQAPELAEVLLEHPHDLGMGDRLDPTHTFETDVVVGDQRDVDVADLQLAG